MREAAGFLPNASTPLAAARPKLINPSIIDPRTTIAARMYLKIADGPSLVGVSTNLKTSDKVPGKVGFELK